MGVIKELLSTQQINLTQTVFKEEMVTVLRALPIRKAPNSDGILNEVLKALIPDIFKGLARVINKLFIGDSLLIGYRESIIIALYKERKRDYSLLNSYRLITLKNTLIKVVEKIEVNYLSVAAEEHGLLL